MKALLLLILYLSLLLAAYASEAASREQTKLNESSASQHRELWGSEWSFTNLMFHIGACKPHPDCPHGPPVSPLHPCGCPDCTKPHEKHFANNYCLKTTDQTEATEEDEEYVEEGSDETASSQGQTPKRTFNWLYYAIGAAAVATVVGAMAMRKRRTETDEFQAGESRDMFSGLSGKIGMMIGGMGLAGAGAAALRTKRTRPLSDADSLNGSVSRRIELLERGDAPSSTAATGDSPPTFVGVVKTRGRSSLTTIMESNEGYELEGPFRPSSQYAV